MVTGHFDKLLSLSLVLETIERVQARASELGAQNVQAQLEHQYESGTDPRGNAWAILAPSTLASGRHDPPLTDTRKMRNASTALKGVKGISVSINRPGGNPSVPKFHQAGTRTMPARPLVPEADEDLPTPWRKAVSSACTEAVVQHLTIGGA